MAVENKIRERASEVFWAFLALGLTSFGGPVAHLGYFRTAFVERRQWLSEQAYADLVALCQFLPGPASSQVGFALGLMRAGPWGAAMAWLAFTLPSAIVLVLFALGAAVLEGPVASGIIHGLKVVAVAIVAHAVWGMARNLCPDKTRTGIALAAVFAVVLVSGPLGQVAAIVLGGVAGLLLCRQSAAASSSESLHFPVTRQAGTLALLIFAGLLVLLPLLAASAGWLNVVDAFYRSGALVFGGGHVVLPLLEAEVVQSGWVTADEFLAGYGAAQAVPGPLFTFAAYLGALLPGIPSVIGALLALLAIFVPGFLLLVGVLPFWNQFRQWSSAQALMRGANAAVVGILGAALYQPVWTSAILGPYEFVLALTGFLLLTVWKLPAWVVVIVVALGGVVITL
ncbi:MAG: chromate efflux transporter [Halomonas sp.]|jgi:chromate transporter|nr:MULTISPECIES: chromate efflux transporter [Halomonas]KTG25186.1 chromate transporter [Idiomarina sp. H105]OAE94791.1 chromate transporter [Idiomarina sp. WRN-38]KJD20318.1 chromate transporter [Halomonas meridiana]MCC4290546.1 chromate efflux transporter [Halomonas axialensis]MCD1652460.1 chromate efflux transporter [Halomonas axialensis]|tara:strand:- start:620 stop:1813 length:1194 start_codon:yes stop_codon:yes gene_type:complete